LARDAEELARFVGWVGNRKEEIGVLFTPWGEALIHKSYRQAITRLSHMPNVRRAAIQTNLSCQVEWLQDCNLEKTALWTTWHPTEVALDRFASQCRRLDELGVRHSVGVVGRREAFAAIKDLRTRLNPRTYLWVNALKRETGYYSDEDVNFLESIDPLFRVNNVRHQSRGLACRAGSTSFTLNGAGDIRRCHFIPTAIGNVYEAGFEHSLVPRLCTNDTCGCHIGYVHLEPLDLYSIFGDGVLERIPDSWKFSGSMQGNRLALEPVRV
jgi:hypothetical protein